MFKLLQTLLNERGHILVVDGKIGPATKQAMEFFNFSGSGWNADRIQVAGLQYLLNNDGHGLMVNGIMDAKTIEAIKDAEAERGIGWKRPDEDERGEPGEHLVYLQCPYDLKLAWDLSVTINRFNIHTLARESAEDAFTQVLEHYGIDEIQRLRLDLFGGCSNDRNVRGGTTKSMHSYGLAIDIDPSHNRLRWGKDKAALAGSEYDAWWEIWESCGWVSLGRTKNYDWMHTQYPI